MTLQEVFLEFYEEKRTYIKPKSAKNYYETIHLFVDYVGKDTQIEDISRHIVNKYCISVNESSKLKQGTKNCYIRNIKIFLRWCVDEYKLTNIVPEKIKVPRMPKKDLKLYTNEEIKMMYNACICHTEWITKRNRTILTLLLDTGVRRNEIRNIKKTDIDYENRRIYIHGKGSKDRIVPFSARTEKLMMEYEDSCPYKECEYVFSGRWGSQLGTDAVKQFLYKLNSKLPFEVSSHRLRHNFATDYALHFLEEYGTSCSAELADIMGHSDTKTTDRYVHIAHKILSIKRGYSRMNYIDW